VDADLLEAISAQVDQVFNGERTAVEAFGKIYRPFRMGRIKAISIPEAGLKFLQQNPNKRNRRTGELSDGARAVRLGHRVVWLLVDERYCGAGILDGRYTPSLHRQLRMLLAKETGQDR